jgi:hypothetical protein
LVGQRKNHSFGRGPWSWNEFDWMLLFLAQLWPRSAGNLGYHGSMAWKAGNQNTILTNSKRNVDNKLLSGLLKVSHAKFIIISFFYLGLILLTETNLSDGYGFTT